MLSVLRLHTLVHELADKFDIELLREHAYQRFLSDWNVNAFSHPLFPKFVEFVYDSTRPTDIRIRLFLTRTIVMYHHANITSADVQEVIAKHEPAAWRIYTQPSRRLGSSDSNAEMSTDPASKAEASTDLASNAGTSTDLASLVSSPEA